MLIIWNIQCSVPEICFWRPCSFNESTVTIFVSNMNCGQHISGYPNLANNAQFTHTSRQRCRDILKYSCSLLWYIEFDWLKFLLILFCYPSIVIFCSNHFSIWTLPHLSLCCSPNDVCWSFSINESYVSQTTFLFLSLCSIDGKGLKTKTCNWRKSTQNK